MSFCPFCQKQDDLRFMKIYGTCEIADGQPCIPCKEYLEIEAEIEKTRQTLKEQLGRRREIRENINRLHDPMVTRVPTEIIAHIFEFVSFIDIDGLPVGGTMRSLREGEVYAPLPLGSVCGAWRHIAWGMPQLWNFMPVQIQTPEQMPPRLDVAKRWLSRSGDYLPLSIDFRINETYEDNENWEEFVPFIDLLKGYSHRWKNLCCISPSYLLGHLFDQLQGNPLLQNIQLTSVDYTDAPGVFYYGKLESRPRPWSLSLYNIFFDFNIGVNWAQVTQLKLDTIAVSTLLDTLTRLNNLKDLRLYGMFDYFEENEPVTHPTLESLHVECPDQITEELCDLLDHLTFPSLQNIKINLLHESDLLNSVTSLIQRSSCKLSSLSVSHFPRSNPHTSLMQLLRRIDVVEELEVFSISKDDGDFLSVLLKCIEICQEDLYSTAHIPLANLRRFTYIPTCVGKIPWNLLLELFDHHWRIQRPQWSTLSIVCHSTSASDPDSTYFLHPGSDNKIISGFLNMAEAGVELFLPKRMDKDSLLVLTKPKPIEFTCMSKEEFESEQIGLEIARDMELLEQQWH